MDNATPRVKAACRQIVLMVIDDAMKERTPKPLDDRGERLAQALRANLHRRKAQARAVDEPPAAADKPDQ